jgi:Tol biopolymer transport system component
VLVTTLDTAFDESGPWLTPDCSRMFFDSTRDGTSAIYTVERGIDGAFGTPTRVSELGTTPGSMTDPSLTTDLRSLVFTRRSGGIQEIWEARR